MITIDMHDTNDNDPVVGKMKSPTHAATAHVDYEYQAEQYVIDAEKDYPRIARIVVDDGRREWVRLDGKFVEKARSADCVEGAKVSCSCGRELFLRARALPVQGLRRTSHVDGGLVPPTGVPS